MAFETLPFENRTELRKAVEAAAEHAAAQATKLVPVRLDWNKSLLYDDDKAFLRMLVTAAITMDELFARQVWQGNAALATELEKLELDDDDPVLHWYHIMNGPFDRIDEFKSFIGTIAHPPGAGYYPEDLTKEEFEHWLEEHPEDEDAFTSPFTLIRREPAEDEAGGEPEAVGETEEAETEASAPATPKGALRAIPYSESPELQPLLRAARRYLLQAAELCENESLATYIRSRAAAFASNDYYQSDCDWMDVTDNLIDLTIGPYEVYEDGLFGYKAAFEAFICLKDPDASAALAALEAHLPALEDALPIPDEHKNPNRGFESPITVADEILVAGDTRAGVQTLAFNLPNDERVREAKGSKKVLLRNVLHAKYDAIFMPIAQMVLEPAAVENCSFDAFFQHTLMHEMGHGLGPGRIERDGETVQVSKALKDHYTTIEEAKADTLGMYCNQWLIDNGHLPDIAEASIYTTFLGGIFRSIRFGVHEAHGMANVIILRYLRRRSAFTYDKKTKLFGIDLPKVKETVKDLAHELLMIEATGDYEAAGEFINKYGKLTRSQKRVLKKLAEIPIDIEPVFDLGF